MPPHISADHLSAISPPTNENWHLDAQRIKLKKKKKGKSTLSAKPRGYAVITINHHNVITRFRPRAVLSQCTIFFSCVTLFGALNIKKESHVRCPGLSFSRSGKTGHKGARFKAVRTRSHAHEWSAKMRRALLYQSFNSYWPGRLYQSRRESRAIINSRPEMQT